LPFTHGEGQKVLEIGCSDGSRLKWLKESLGFECYGIDPSTQAVQVASSRGITAEIGTANNLPFDDNMFDIVIFGFCLYLCDREDLFRIAAEADRVLKSPGWLLIEDFYSPIPLKREYHHRNGLFSYKMDYRTLFTWSPSYTCYSQKVTHHAEPGYTDDSNEWVATSVLRKNLEKFC
jgi:ubiquinone/menaquinone biosynthesis C-methylase UbiE